MRYQLDTIPVWDALKADTECPLCKLRSDNERMYVESFLGASVMEPSTRVEVNQKGFCAAHFNQLFQEKNRLGLALITDTYMRDVMDSVQSILQSAEQGSGGLSRLFGTSKGDGSSPGHRIHARIGDCILCDRLNATMERYCYTLLHLWAHDRDFQTSFESSKGLCLPHMAQTLDMADQASGVDAAKYRRMLAKLMQENLQRVEKELEWFTLKFDYRNQDKPWGTSEDALPRAIQKLKALPKGQS